MFNRENTNYFISIILINCLLMISCMPVYALETSGQTLSSRIIINDPNLHIFFKTPLPEENGPHKRISREEFKSRVHDLKNPVLKKRLEKVLPQLNSRFRSIFLINRALRYRKDVLFDRFKSFSFRSVDSMNDLLTPLMGSRDKAFLSQLIFVYGLIGWALNHYAVFPFLRFAGKVDSSILDEILILVICYGAGIFFIAGMAIAPNLFDNDREIVEAHKRFRKFSTKVTHMLRFENYRKHLYAGKMFSKTRKLLEKAGINKWWDDPEYVRVYKISGKRAQKIIETSNGKHSAFVKDAIKLYLDSKKMYNFIKEESYTIDRVKKENISRNEAIYFLMHLKKEMELKFYPDRDVDKVNKMIEILENQAEDRPIRGMVEARIWQRDPWVDFRASSELYACIYLGGSQEQAIIERMNNPSITMLDFYNHKGIILRADLAAGRFFDTSKKEWVPTLIVTSTEGSDMLNPSLVKQGIEEYAVQAGFSQVLYFSEVFNSTPKRIIKYIADKTQDTALGIYDVKLFTKEYFSYYELFLNKQTNISPKGKVKGYLVQVEKEKNVIIRNKAITSSDKLSSIIFDPKAISTFIPLAEQAI